jgi:hypothetical protein
MQTKVKTATTLKLLKGELIQKSVPNKHMGACLGPQIWAADMLKIFLIRR